MRCCRSRCSSTCPRCQPSALARSPVTIETIGRSRLGPLAAVIVPPNAMSGSSRRKMRCFGMESGPIGGGHLIAGPCCELVDVDQLGARHHEGLNRKMPPIFQATVCAVELAEVLSERTGGGFD